MVMKFNESRDGVDRCSVQLRFRLSRGDLEDLLGFGLHTGLLEPGISSSAAADAAVRLVLADSGLRGINWDWRGEEDGSASDEALRLVERFWPDAS